MKRLLLLTISMLLTAVTGLQASEPIRIASFNIQFLGQFKSRDNDALAHLLAPYDLIFVQELDAPPYAGVYPNGESYRSDPEARKFFDAMRSYGFTYWISEEDTGTGPTIHHAGSSTEWFVAFYKPERVQPAAGLPGGFLAEDRSDNPDFERVPYAFSFRAGGVDLVFISVHLKPGSGTAAKARRKHELAAVGHWISAQSGAEKDYVVLGDMNIENCAELSAAIITEFVSMNADCRATNTNPASPRPYDHVWYNPGSTSNEIDVPHGLTVMNMVEALRNQWSGASPYPGDPYDHNAFRQRYSDHNPIVFQLRTGTHDDD